MENEILYYYLRRNGHPYGCVAIRENEDNTINRGVSLCSDTDEFVKSKARGIAFQRLVEVSKLGKNIPFDNYKGMNKTIPVENEFTDKASYHVEPTKGEYRMLHKPF